MSNHLTTGAGSLPIPIEQEEEKEVDPSLIGSLDNVYTEETEAAMNKVDDPFTNVVITDSVATPAEMEKTVNALVIYSSEHSEHSDCTSPLPEDEGASCSHKFIGEKELDLLTPSQQSIDSSVSQELLPDILTSPNSLSDELSELSVANHSTLPPDIAPPHGTLPPDLAAVTPLDLLNTDFGTSSLTNNSSPLDLTKDVPN